MRNLFIILACCSVLLSCNKGAGLSNNQIEVSGVIRTQGITTYQYGTHTISGYAIRSYTIDLDTYLNQNVTVVGRKIEGYPIEGGPDYLEIEKIKD